MGKAKKGGAVSRAPRKKNTRLWQAVLAILVLGAVSVPFLLRDRDSATTPAVSPADPVTANQPLRDHLVLPASPRKPRPATLDPDSFTDPEVRVAYQAAKETPEPLENVACYCGCFGNSGHRNNLDCFHDDHGKTWGLCRAIALEAHKEYKAGTPIDQIKHNIDERWAPPVQR